MKDYKTVKQVSVAFYITIELLNIASIVNHAIVPRLNFPARAVFTFISYGRLLMKLLSLSFHQEIWKTEHKKISVPVWTKVEVPVHVEHKVPEWKVSVESKLSNPRAARSEIIRYQKSPS